MIDLKNCYGKFKISVDLIEARPDAVLAVMSEVIITRAELRYDDQHIHYHGMSSHFTKLAPGENVPLYHVVIDSTALDAGYKDVVKFQR